jgi:Cu2+-exporting ATPase
MKNNRTSHSDQHNEHPSRQEKNHYAHMVADFRRRFWVALVLSIPTLMLAPLIQGILGLAEVLRFPGDRYIQFVLANAAFFMAGGHS